MPFNNGIGTCSWVGGGCGPSFVRRVGSGVVQMGGRAFFNETIAVFSSKGIIIMSFKEEDCKRFQGHQHGKGRAAETLPMGVVATTMSKGEGRSTSGWRKMHQKKDWKGEGGCFQQRTGFAGVPIP